MEHLPPIADDGPRSRTVTFVDQLTRAKGGDQSAVSSLLAENRSWLRRKADRFLSRRAKQHADPSDLAQECLATAAEHLPQFRGNSIQAFRAWLGTILVNKIRNFLRRNRRRLARSTCRKTPMAN